MAGLYIEGKTSSGDAKSILLKWQKKILEGDAWLNVVPLNIKYSKLYNICFEPRIWVVAGRVRKWEIHFRRSTDKEKWKNRVRSSVTLETSR